MPKKISAELTATKKELRAAGVVNVDSDGAIADELALWLHHRLPTNLRNLVVVTVEPVNKTGKPKGDAMTSNAIDREPTPKTGLPAQW